MEPHAELKGFIGSMAVFCGQIAAIWLFLDWFESDKRKSQWER